ncbi:MAG: Cof-type HAD-IIB family hydrolase [Erysipelotrichaceae bacterium]|nr:Cof-type HAD-IIB family hydrolase [Erysipelotrichaceae bacterium]
MIRLFASDLDGTLLNQESQLEEETLEAVRDFQKQGGIFMLATGRNSWEVSQVSNHLSDVVYNCVNGSLLCDGEGKQIVSYAIEEKEAIAFERLRKELNSIVLYHSENCRYCNLSLEELRNAIIRYLIKENGYTPERAQEFFHYMFGDGKTVFSSSLEDVLPSRILKLEFLFIDGDLYREQIRRCHEVFRGCNVVNGSFFNNIEITSPRSGKGKLIREYCRIAGIKEEETAVIGDSGNDIEMLRCFRNSYAMGNATGEVKEVANYLAEDNENNGVAKVLKEICRKNREEKDA